MAARKRVQEEEDEDEEPSSSLLNTVHDIKLGQKLRQKKIGAEFTSDGPATGTESKSKHAVKKEGASSSSSSSSSSTMLGNTQFESRIDTGLSGANPIAHEKIMEQYIKEKMGVNDESSSSNSDTGKPVPTADDELYRLPDDIRRAGQIPNAAPVGEPKQGVDDESAMVSMSISIAEVALPIGFKLQNIEETEHARQKLEAKYHRGVGNTVLATSRFWNPAVHRPKKAYDNVNNSSSGNAVGGNNQPGKQGFNNSGGGGGLAGDRGGVGRGKRSSDDNFVKEFKKRQKF